MAENVNIPENADKILFAEDLITFMMLRNARVNYRGTTDRYRDFVHNGFNETTRQAVRFLDNTMEMSHDDIFDFIKNANAVNHITYMRFAKDICTKYFPDGFDANHFLHYCVHLGSMAAYFYNHGVPEAPNLAVMYIVNAIQYFNMSTGGWDTLQRISERYATMEFDSLNTLSPSSNDSEEDLEQYAVNIIPVIVVDEKKAEGENVGHGSNHDVIVNKVNNVEVNSNKNILASRKDIKISSKNALIKEKIKKVNDLKKEDDISQDLPQSSKCNGEKNSYISSEENVNEQEGLHLGRKKLQTKTEQTDDKKVKCEKSEPGILDRNQETALAQGKHSSFISDSKYTELQKSMLAIRQYFKEHEDEILVLDEKSEKHSELSDESLRETDLDREGANASTSSILSPSEAFQFDKSEPARTLIKDCDKEIGDCTPVSNVALDKNNCSETINNNVNKGEDSVESSADAKQTISDKFNPSASAASD